jgi:hypothetical protein
MSDVPRRDRAMRSRRNDYLTEGASDGAAVDNERDDHDRNIAVRRGRARKQAVGRNRDAGDVGRGRADVPGER